MADYKIPDQYEYEGIILNKIYFPPSSIEKTKTFSFGDGDVLLASYPKCGITWVSQLVTLILSNGDTETASMKETIDQRVKYMELQVNPKAPANVDILAKTPAPRVMKTHLPPYIFKKALEEGKVKFIVPMRNPKDCLVSYYHFYRAMASLGNFPGTWGEFFELFRAKGLKNGDWLEMNLSWWNERHRKNVLIVKYEDTHRDPKAAILRLSSFLGTDVSDDVMEKILKESSFESMKENPLANMTSIPKFVYNSSICPFIRKGIVGDWRNVFNEEQSAYVDQNYTAPAAEQGLVFEFDK